MRTIVVYKEQSDHARAVQTFMDDFTRQTGKVLETLNPDTAEGAHTCASYDIVEYPSIIALDDSGVMQYLWRGLPTPTVSEVAYYA